MHKKRLSYKNDGIVNERILFHGTRQTSPDVIYMGEFGFDNRFCSKGSFGIASYFAQDAKYSDKYAHVTINWSINCNPIIMINDKVSNSC